MGGTLLRWCARRIGEFLLLGASYVALALIATYPLVVNFTRCVPGGAYGDVWQFINQFWWFKKALIEQGVNPYFDPYMFYPSGVSLASTTLTPFNTLLSVPLQLVFDLPTTYNLLFLLTFVMTGYGTFALAEYLIQDRWAAFGSSIIFTFSPYRLMRGFGHLNLLTTQFIPLYILFLFKTLRTRRVKDAVLAGVFLALVGLSSEVYLLQIVLLSLILAPALMWWAGVEKQSFATLIRPLLAGSGVFLILALPFYYQTLLLICSGDANLELPLWYVSMNSADLMAFFTPNPSSSLYASISSAVYSHIAAYPVETAVFPGYVTIGLAMPALLARRSRETYLWTVVALIFGGLSLGPELHISGMPILDLPYKTTIYPIMPFYIPSRFSVTYLVAISILAGYGFTRLLAKRAPRLRHLTCAALCLLIFAESTIIPYPLSATTAPKIYYEMRDDEEMYALMEVPISPSPVPIGRYLYYQTIHQKPIIGGWVSRLPHSTLRSLQQNPMVRKLMEIHQGMQTGPVDVVANLQLLKHQNVRYVIVHTGMLSDGEWQQIEGMLGHLPSQVVEDQTDPLIVYRLL